MQLNKIIFLILILLGISSSNPIFNTSIYDKYKLAEAYYDSELYDDAIIIYEEILEIQKSIEGLSHSILLKITEKIYQLHILNNNTEKAKEYLQEYISIQSSHILQLQETYIQPLNELKNIYINEKEPDLVFRIDSLLTIINTNMDKFPVDSLLNLPDLLVNTDPNYEVDTEYSINDYALEKMNEGFNHLNNHNYNDAIINFNNSLMLNAKSLDMNYFESIDFNTKKDTLYDLFLINAEQDSTNMLPYFYLGLLKYFDQKYEQSIAHFQHYSESNLEDIKPLLFLGKINFLESNFLDAIFYFYRALKINQNNLEENLYLAKSLIQIKDYNESIKILKYIFKENKNNYDLIFSLGTALYFTGENEEAINYLTQSLLLKSDDYNTYYYLGLSYNQLDLNKKSLEAYKKCLEINPDFSLAHYEIGKIYELILDDNKAIEHFKLAKRNSSFDDLNYRLGMIYYKNEMFLKAMNPMRDYIINNLNDFYTLQILGDIFLKVERYSEAIDTYSRLIISDENNENYYLNIANSHYKLNNFSDALTYYKKVIDLNDTNHEIFFKIGLILNKENLFNEAELYFNKALECGPLNKELLIELGQCYAGQKKFLQSMLTFKEALQFSLEDPIIHYQLGVIYKELQMYDLAVDNFLFFIKFHDDDDITYSLIGDSYFELEQYKDAIKYFNKAYKINYNIKPLFKIGKSYQKLEDTKNAIKYFKNVLKKNPDHVKSRIQLIKVYKQLNREKEIKRECEIVYMLDRSAYNMLTPCIQSTQNKK